jgi:hypothetical protein
MALCDVTRARIMRRRINRTAAYCGIYNSPAHYGLLLITRQDRTPQSPHRIENKGRIAARVTASARSLHQPIANLEHENHWQQ